MTLLTFISPFIYVALYLHCESIKVFRLCNNHLNGMYNLNLLLGIDRNLSQEFETDMNMSVVNWQYRWYVNSYTEADTNLRCYNNGIVPTSYNDLNLVIDTFQAELYIDVDLTKYIPIQICGTMREANIAYHENPSLEVCKAVSGMTFEFPWIISKVRFSQILGENIKIFEFYPDFILASSIENTSSIVLTKLVFKLTAEENDTNIVAPGPGFGVIFHDCDMPRLIETQDPDPSIWGYVSYEERRILIWSDHICDFVKEGEIYELLHFEEQSNETFIILEAKLYLQRDMGIPPSNTNDLYLYINGNFKFLINPDHSYCIIRINMTKLAKVFTWQQMPITSVTQFSINMTRNVPGKCSLVLYNFATRTVEEHIFCSNEKFNLTQTERGVSGFSIMNVNAISVLNYPDCYIAKVSCDTQGQVIPNIFNISPHPRIVLELKLKTCK